MSSETRATDGFESATLRAPRLLAIAAMSLVLLFASIGGLALMFNSEVRNQSVPAPRTFPQPRLRVDEPQQLHALEAAQRKSLDQYRWIDRKNGLIAIPIKRAMELIAGRGADAYQPVAALPPAPSKATP